MDNYINLTPYMYSYENNIKYKKIKQTEKNIFNDEESNIFSFTKLKIFFYLYKNELDISYKDQNEKIITILENINIYKDLFKKYNYYKKNKIIEDLNDYKKDNEINLTTFSFLCTIHNIYFLVKNKTFFYTNLTTLDEIDFKINKLFILDESTKELKELNFILFKEKLIEVKNILIEVKNPEKLIEPISNYKISDLNELTCKLKIKIEKKMNKKDLYNYIKENIKPSLFFTI